MNSQDKPVNIESAVAFIRHELRTPINAIVGYGEMVQEDLEEDDSPFLPQLNDLLSETKDLLKAINVLVKLSDDNSYEVKNLKKLFISIPHTTNPSIEKIILYSNNLLSNIDEINIQQDVEKIRLSAIRLQGLVNNIDSIFDNFLESLNANQESSEFQANSSKEKSHNNQNNSLEIINNDPNKLSGRILVIDDNTSNLDLLFRHLTRKGHSVTTSLSAKEALTLLESENYDLILLDLIMPEINGDKFLQYLKNSPDFQHIPVIMISALDEFDNVIRCIEMGAEDFLPKPFDPVLLKARIDSSLEKKRLRDQEKLYTRQVEALSAIMEKELEKGRQMQKNFLPADLLVKAGWEFSAFFSPARQLAGDFYDLFDLPGNCVGIVVADVCDKGVGAALFMGLFRSLIRIFSGQAALDSLTNLADNLSDPSLHFDNTNSFHPLDAIKLINNYVATNHGDASMFATIFFGILELDTGKLSYINGGHEPVFIVDHNYKIKETLRSTGPAVGMLPNLNFKIGEILLDLNDVLIAYTDGVTEAKSETGDFFSKEKLTQTIEMTHGSAKELMEDVQALLIEHIGAAEQFDDITLLALKRV